MEENTNRSLQERKKNTMALGLSCSSFLLCLLLAAMYGFGHGSRNLLNHAEDEIVSLEQDIEEKVLAAQEWTSRDEFFNHFKLNRDQSKTQIEELNLRDAYAKSFLWEISERNIPIPTELRSQVDESNLGMFILDDLHVGKVFSIHFPNRDTSTRFLHNTISDSIPFKLSELPKTLNLLSIPRDSNLAKRMELTLKLCESKHSQGDTKKCTTSIESLVEFLQGAFGPGTNVGILTTSSPIMSTSKLLNYTILKFPEEIESMETVVCHPLGYAYAVFLCHYFASETKVFKLSLGLDNGHKIESVAVCHMDTSGFDPNNLVFRVLGIKNGQPVCHFLPPGTFVSVQSPIKSVPFH